MVTHLSLIISQEASDTVQRWREYVDLHRYVSGEKVPVSLAQACAILIEDLTEKMREDEEYIRNYWVKIDE